MTKPKKRAKPKKKPRRVVLGVGRLWHGHYQLGLCENGHDVVIAKTAEAIAAERVRLVAEVLA